MAKLAKGNMRFAPVMYLNATLEQIERMPQMTKYRAVAL